jgi:hypothetical protein
VDDDGQQIGYLALPRGTPVVSADGVEIGSVYKVLDNAREHIFDGIVVKGSDGRMFVDAPEVVRITDRRVLLSIDAAATRNLPRYRGWRGRFEHKARRRLDRMRRNMTSR